MRISSEYARDIDYYFFGGPDLDGVIGGYRKLTGEAPMMARWTWGLWQSKERYASQDELFAVADKYRQRDMPLDAVIQDWQYWEPGQWGSHRFDPARYPDPKAMVSALHEKNVHTIISVWPRLDQQTANLAELEQVNGIYPKVYPNVYPAGQGKWYDPFNPKASSSTGRRYSATSVYWVSTVFGSTPAKPSWEGSGAKCAKSAPARGLAPRSTTPIP